MARGSGAFGISTSSRGRGRGGSRGRYRGYFRGRARGGAPARNGPAPARADDATQLEDKFENVRQRDEIDEKLGFHRVSDGPKREGWMVNMHPTLMQSEDWPSGRAGVDYYFIQDDGCMFKVTLLCEPYFYIACKHGSENTIEEWLMKKYEGLIPKINRMQKEDLKLPNHLLGHRRLYLQIMFRNVGDLLAVRKDIMPLALANSAKLTAVDAYAEVVHAEAAGKNVYFDGDDEAMAWGLDVEAKKGSHDRDPREGIIDIREFDVPYYLRVAIDNDIRVGLWYSVTFVAGQPSLARIPERVKRAEPVVLAFDIETTKAPLKFPDQNIDQVMMISYMVDGQGFLITNREIVSEDIEDFEYTPKDEYHGPFTVFNEKDEEATIRRFFEHIQTAKPTVMATFNGDLFDFPFLCARAAIHGIDMFIETGFAKDQEDEFKSRTCIHMDCFRWVKRDSYLPQGSQGLKAVTTAKLGYNPHELDPELMTPYALEKPHILAEYSVSDAVATYYLYMKYVHPFIFSLCNIIPLCGDEVLRKGSGTLCETLLMVEAYRGNIIMPNRHEDVQGNMFEGHLVATETYVGGHVEALEAGVFRSDIATHFKIVPEAVQQLINDLDAALKFCIVGESRMKLETVINYDEIKGDIQSKLEEIRDNPTRFDKPLIYHLDVAAMYPNIMLSNRLQPDAMINESVCAVCDYNRPGKTCDRHMTWAWRGEFFPAQRDEYNMVRHALYQEEFPPKYKDGPKRKFIDLSSIEQTALLHKRLGDYSRKVYRKTKDTRVVNRDSIVCQRENPFYIDTVRSFRDRRYEYKAHHKAWKKNLDTAIASGGVAEIEEAKKMIVLYDSLQLAHKCILNSFYGYVMRKGARWHSMEMAGITCLTGATIIQMARQLVEQIGRPLELDTDGIWCMLPGIFPENFTFNMSDGKKLFFSYPSTMLNHLVNARFTNHQYHDLVDPQTGKWEVHSENSIFFELDGPYKAMILPSSKEEDKLLKKRYAVFNDDGSLAELKGFEVKRRGELQLIKIFQSAIFEKFLLGTTTEECYGFVAEVADQWLDVLFSRGIELTDNELVDLIAENRSMSKTLQEYGQQKSTSISTAKRLAEFLGNQMVKDKGLACRFIISAKPPGAPVTERAVPVAIFSAEESVKRQFLRKWLKDNSMVNFDIRSILDWDYYIERLGSVIQKLITIPAAMQMVSNPVPRIRHPDWLSRRVASVQDKFQQHKVTDFFKQVAKPYPQEKSQASAGDIEEMGMAATPKPKIAIVNRKVAEQSPKEKQLPDPSINYPAWLKAIRPRWKKRREGRHAGTSIAVPSMFRGVKTRTSTSWDIIQIRPTERDGRFRMWLAVDSEIVQVKLRVPREFYLNLKTTAANDFFLTNYSSTEISRTLPRTHPSPHLYKITVSEDTFKHESSHFAYVMNNPLTDGVYETQITHEARAILKLGTVCSVATGQQQTTLNQARTLGFDLNQLERSSPSLQKRIYLDEGHPFKYIFVFHASSSSSNLHVFAVFYPDSRVKLHVVDPSRDRRQLPRLQDTYTSLKEKVRGLKTTSKIIDYPDSLNFDTAHHTTDATAMKAISRELGTQDTHTSIVIIAARKQQRYFEHGIEKLNNFPILLMPSNKAPHSLDDLSWQSHVVSRMLGRYLRLGDWLQSSIENSIYYDIPIGNVPADASLFFIDVAFARRLMKQDILLWWSPGARPDLGGREHDGSAAQLADELISPEFSTPGCYMNVCLSVQVRNLAVNSVLQAAMVNELEGAGGATAFDSVSHTLNDYTNGEAQSSITLGDAVLSPQTFAILKAMVKSWMLDTARSIDSPAGIAVSQFWRWISTPTANMFDLGMQRFVHGLMKKTFIQMLAEFKRLGSNIIHANFNQLLLLTSKPPGTAAAYATYITTAVSSHELFKHITLHTERFYDFLLYMDPSNQGALVCDDPLAIEGLEKASYASSWNIQSFLPHALQPYFHDAVKKFIIDMHNIRFKYNDAGRTPLRVLNATQTLGVQQDENKHKEQGAVRAYIETRLTRRMLSVVSKVAEMQRESLGDDDMKFPLLPGSYLQLTNQSLEFIKFTTAVFGLAKEYNIEVSLLKRTVLDLINVREFSEEAIFRNPCESFKLQMVMCPVCTFMRDFDFCRDIDLLEAPSKQWKCSECGSEYDRRAIERTMIDVVRRMELSTQVQDLKCVKCKRIKVDNLGLYCSCSGAMQRTVEKADTKRKLRTIVNVAKVYHLTYLEYKY